MIKHQADEVLASLRVSPHWGAFEWALCFSKYDVIGLLREDVPPAILAASLHELDHLTLSHATVLSRILPPSASTQLHVTPPSVLVHHPMAMDIDAIAHVLGNFGSLQSCSPSPRVGVALAQFHNATVATALLGAVIPVNQPEPMTITTGDRGKDAALFSELSLDEALENRLAFCRSTSAAQPPPLTAANLAALTN